MTFTLATKTGTLNITTIEREVAHHISPSSTVRQFGLQLQAPWQSGPTTEWFATVDERDYAEGLAVASYRKQA